MINSSLYIYVENLLYQTLYLAELMDKSNSMCSISASIRHLMSYCVILIKRFNVLSIKDSIRIKADWLMELLLLKITL